MTTHFVSSLQPYTSFQQPAYWPGHTPSSMLPHYQMPYSAWGAEAAQHPSARYTPATHMASPVKPHRRHPRPHASTAPTRPNPQKETKTQSLHVQKQTASTHSTPKSDIFRDAPLRYMGYLNELGESFRGVIPNAVVKASYQLTGAYCVADAVSKGISGYRNGSGDTSQRAVHALSEAADAGAFQFIASYYVPAKIIEVASDAARRFAKKQTAWTPKAKRIFPTAVGLGLVPFLVAPVDKAAHFILNHTLRDLLGRPHQSH